MDAAARPGQRASGTLADRAVRRPLVPPPVAGSGLPYETSETIMRRDRPSRRLAVLGGGYVAAELAHVFAAAGAEIVMIEKAGLLQQQDETVVEEYTALVRERYDLRLGREATGLSGEPGALRLELDDGSAVEADTLLVAQRRPHGPGLRRHRGRRPRPRRGRRPPAHDGRRRGRWATCARACR